MSGLKVWAVLLILVVMPSCIDVGPQRGEVIVQDGTVEGTGRIAFDGSEGGYHYIHGDNDVMYKPDADSDSAAWEEYHRLVEEYPSLTSVEFAGTIAEEHGNVFGAPLTYVELIYIRLR